MAIAVAPEHPTVTLLRARLSALNENYTDVQRRRRRRRAGAGSDHRQPPLSAPASAFASASASASSAPPASPNTVNLLLLQLLLKTYD